MEGRRAILAKAHGRDKSLPKYALSHHDRTIGAPSINQDPEIEGTAGVLRPSHHDRTIGAPGFNQDPEIEGTRILTGGWKQTGKLQAKRNNPKKTPCGLEPKWQQYMYSSCAL